jgi:telomere length regulation protein
MNSLLRLISLKHFSTSPVLSQGEEWWKVDSDSVSSVAGLVHCLINGDEDLRSSAIEWLIGSRGGGVGEPIGIRRALVAVLAQDDMVLKNLLESSLQQFTDKLWIGHAPVLRQEGWSKTPSAPRCLALGEWHL